jgi:hypothetical protein
MAAWMAAYPGQDGRMAATRPARPKGTGSVNLGTPGGTAFWLALEPAPGT